MRNDPLVAMNQNQSFWQFKWGDYRPNKPFGSGRYSADVVIIGGGYTGLTAAREIKADAPHQRVVVLEAREIGFGASGRNGGFNMTLFGLEPEVTLMRWGRQRTEQAQAYMQKAVAFVKDLIEDNNLDSDYEHTGMWRVAYSDKQRKRLEKTYSLLSEISGPKSFEYLDARAVASKLNAPQMRAAIFEKECGILDPCKHVRELKRLAMEWGVEIFENTEVIGLSRTDTGLRVQTHDANITCENVVVATNAWSHQSPGPRKIRNRQSPVWTYQIVSEPLTPEEWQQIGWSERMSIEDNRQFVHYMRVTKCGRITIGGGDIEADIGRRMHRWHSEQVWDRLEKHFRWLFPTLRHKKIAFKWGGAVSVNLDMTPEISFIGDERIIMASGCIGHGVSLTQLNGRLIADLIAGKDSPLTGFWIVNRRAVPMPPGNLLSYIGIKTISSILHGVDRYEERELRG